VCVVDSYRESKSQSDSRGRLRTILRPGGHAKPVEVGVLRQVVLEPTTTSSVSMIGQKEFFNSNSTWNGFETMSPRRCQDRSMPDPVVEREMREIRAQLDVMETT
jgi:hypothetical protein